jgi:hypothetical protein
LRTVVLFPGSSDVSTAAGRAGGGLEAGVYWCGAAAVSLRPASVIEAN